MKVKKWLVPLGLCLILSLLLAGCGNENEGNESANLPGEDSTLNVIGGDSNTNEEVPADDAGEEQLSTEEQVMQAAGEVLPILADQQIDQLVEWVHPEKGIRFSPYAYVNVEDHQQFSPEELMQAWESKEKRVWGSFDGSGEPIELTVEAYMKTFVYDAPFLEADDVGYNHRIGQGNTVNNAFEAYPNANLVEYHIAGMDASLEGMDWRSLRLAFEKHEGSWYLVGIIHDQWTI
ncbi:hypothetical protein [Marinicrinis sediminis]|uniref:Nuclear transport factor 2 family protein n=1 Tax=Marinicrinis sediminis TaxID=1652465 RepID=A0ABW5RFE9_9BACL